MAYRALLSFLSIAFAIGVFAIPALAFVGPAANPPTGDGKLKIDANGNLYTATGTTIGFGEAPDATTDTNTAGTTNPPLFKIKGNLLQHGRFVSVGQIWARSFIGYDGEAVGESGNIKADGTVSGASLSGALSASYVSAGVFGSSATKGNYTFQAAATTTPVMVIDATNQRVGIGIANPQNLLHINTSSVNGYIEFETQGLARGNIFGVEEADNIVIGADEDNLGGSSEIRFRVDGSQKAVINSSGRIGIATSTPAYTLDVWGTARFTQPVIVGTPTGNTHAATKSYVDSAITGGETSTSTTALACDGDATCEVKAISITAGGTGNIGNVNKLTVSVIDPIYTIGGTRYATYVSGMTGLKEETSGTLTLNSNCPIQNTKCAIIDFNTVPQGSDIWLFYEIADFGNNWNDLSVLLTPAFNGIAWYEKHPEQNKIMVYGAVQDAHYEVSYRLTAPRFDHAKWPNLADPDDVSEGLFIR